MEGEKSSQGISAEDKRETEEALVQQFKQRDCWAGQEAVPQALKRREDPSKGAWGTCWILHQP